MTTVDPETLTQRLRPMIDDASHWIVLAPRSEAPLLLAPLIAALETDSSLGPEDVLRGGLDCFTPPNMFLRLVVVMIHRTCLDRDRLVELLAAGGYPQFPAEESKFLFALFAVHELTLVIDFLRHVYDGRCIPVSQPECG